MLQDSGRSVQQNPEILFIFTSDPDGIRICRVLLTSVTASPIRRSVPPRAPISPGAMPPGDFSWLDEMAVRSGTGVLRRLLSQVKSVRWVRLIWRLLP